MSCHMFNKSYPHRYWLKRDLTSLYEPSTECSQSTRQDLIAKISISLYPSNSISDTSLTLNVQESDTSFRQLCEKHHITQWIY